MNAETPVMQAIRLAVGGRADTRIFRNNVGMARLADGTMRAYGLCSGSSDLIGWRTIVVTPQLLGKRIAVFTAIEVKAPGGRTDPKRLAAQEAFVAAVRDAGGLAGLADSVAAAQAIVERIR